MIANVTLIYNLWTMNYCENISAVRMRVKHLKFSMNTKQTPLLTSINTDISNNYPVGTFQVLGILRIVFISMKQTWNIINLNKNRDTC